MGNTLTLGDVNNKVSYLSPKVGRINKRIIGKGFGITPDSFFFVLMIILFSFYT